MKQKDIALIVVVVIISAVISMFASKALFTNSKSSKQTAEVVKPITTEFAEPDSKYFNKNAFDPTKPITIEQNQNKDPFSGSTQ